MFNLTDLLPNYTLAHDYVIAVGVIKFDICLIEVAFDAGDLINKYITILGSFKIHTWNLVTYVCIPNQMVDIVIY